VAYVIRRLIAAEMPRGEKDEAGEELTRTSISA
jgi:hypothetical protein